jgi:hypothetical protein
MGETKLGELVAQKPPVNATGKRGFTMKKEGGSRPAEEGSLNEHKPKLRERAAHQVREFLVMFIYLWVLLTLFVINHSIVLAREAHNYQAHFFAFVNALVLAKVLLIGEDLHLGNKFRDAPLVYSILYKCLVFTIFFLCFHIVERVITGLWNGRTFDQSFSTIGGGSLKGILSLGATFFVALIPFFAFREIGRVIGESELWSLLLTRGTRVYTLQSMPQ